jgi:hypothetical protein
MIQQFRHLKIKLKQHGTLSEIKQKRLIIIKQFLPSWIDNKTIFPNQAADALNDYVTRITNRFNTQHINKNVLISFLQRSFFNLFLKWYTFQLLIPNLKIHSFL